MTTCQPIGLVLIIFMALILAMVIWDELRIEFSARSTDAAHIERKAPAIAPQDRKAQR